MIACFALVACALAPAASGAGAGRPPVSLVASPSHVTLAARGRQAIEVTNSGTQTVALDVTRAGFALDLRGRPEIVRRRAGSAASSWLAVRPRRLAIGPGRTASLVVASSLPRQAEPGDHDALVLLTTRPQRHGALAVQVRLGIVVVARVPGRIVRRLDLLWLRPRRRGRARTLELLVANRGNVTERLSRDCLAVSLHRSGRVLARPVPVPRVLRPRTRGIVELRYAGRVRGAVLARVELAGGQACGRRARRTFPVRL